MTMHETFLSQVEYTPYQGEVRPDEGKEYLVQDQRIELLVGNTPLELDISTGSTVPTPDGAVAVGGTSYRIGLKGGQQPKIDLVVADQVGAEPFSIFLNRVDGLDVRGPIRRVDPKMAASILEMTAALQRDMAVSRTTMVNLMLGPGSFRIDNNTATNSVIFTTQKQ